MAGDAMFDRLDPTRKLSRRRFLRLGGAGLAGMALLGTTGCGGGEQSKGGTQLTFTFGPDAGGGLRTLIDRFNKQHRGDINVKWRQTPVASADYFDQIKSELQSGKSNIDVIGGDVIWPAQFAAAGFILDLSNRFTSGMRSKHLHGPLEAVQYKGKTYGVPWFTDAGMFYYRKDLLKESGFSEPPKTWDEMKGMVQKIQGDSSVKYGYVFQGSADEGGVVDALEYIWNAGGDVLRGKKVVVNSPQSREGLALRRAMITDGIAPKASGDYTTQESQSVFTNGDVIFMRNWSYVYGLLSDLKTSKVKPEQVDIAPLPVSKPGARSFSGLGGWNFMVNVSSEDKLDEAWTFIKFMSSPESQKTFALQSARLPTLKSLYDDSELLKKVPVAALGKESIKNTRPRPVSPYYSDMSLKMADSFNAALKGETPVNKALKDLQKELQNVVDQGS